MSDYSPLPPNIHIQVESRKESPQQRSVREKQATNALLRAMGRASGFSLTEQQERDVLRFDPWGDRDATYRVLRSGFGVCRKPHECAICFGPVAPGDRIWARTETDDGIIKTFHFCAECCWCIARRYDETEDGEAFGFDRMYERWEIGRKRADQRRLETR
jgi:hypothetical protein